MDEIREKSEPWEVGSNDTLSRLAKEPKQFRWDNFDYKKARFTNVAALLLPYDDGKIELILSATTTDLGWRGDITVTAILKTSGLVSFAEYPLPVVQSFCGSLDHVKKTTISPAHFDLTERMSLNLDGPYWKRC